MLKGRLHQDDFPLSKLRVCCKSRFSSQVVTNWSLEGWGVMPIVTCNYYIVNI